MTNTKKPEWKDIQEAVEKEDLAKINAYGKFFGKPRLEQESVTREEVKQQILDLAPGESPHIGPLLLDLAEKMK